MFLSQVESEDFGDLLAQLKATHSNLQSLTGGLADASEGNNVENMVKKIFDAIDMDGSGLIDREELAAAIIRFDRNHDPEFLDRVLEEENLTEMEVWRGEGGSGCVPDRSSRRGGEAHQRPPLQCPSRLSFDIQMVLCLFRRPPRPPSAPRPYSPFRWT